MAISDYCLVEAAFGVAPYDDTALAIGGNWTDITADVRRIKAKTSSRSAEFQAFTAGHAQIVLDNQDRDYDARYASSPYTGDLVRHVPIRISGDTGSGFEFVWHGYSRTWTPNFKMPDAVTVLDARDGLWLLSRHGLAPSTRVAEPVPDRIGAVLDAVGHPSTHRDLGGTSVRVQSSTYGRTALAEIVRAVQAEGGVFFHDPSTGDLRYDSRGSFGADSRYTATALTLSDTSEPTYLLDSLVDSAVGEDFLNLVEITPAGGTTQTVDKRAADEAASSYEATLQLESETEALALANFYADLYSTPTPAAKSCKVRLFSTTTSIRPTGLNANLRDRVTLSFDPPGAGGSWTDDLFVDSITHDITPSEWIATYTFTSADAYDDNLSAPPSEWMILGAVTTSELAVGKLAY